MFIAHFDTETKFGTAIYVSWATKSHYWPLQFWHYQIMQFAKHDHPDQFQMFHMCQGILAFEQSLIFFRIM